ncbi:MAG TPA: tetratricopeptide repeat protein [Bacteroidales bacterium]
MAKNFGKIGRAYHHWGYLDSAIIYHDSAIECLNQLVENFEPELRNSQYPTYNEWAINYANQLEEKAGVQLKTGNLDNLENDLLLSVRLRSDADDKLGVAMSFDKLGELYTQNGQFLHAIKMYDSALLVKQIFYEKLNAKRDKLSSSYWNNIINESKSFTLLKIGELYSKWGKAELAFDFFSQSIDLSKQIGYKKGIAAAMISQGDHYLSTQQPDEALSVYDQAKKIYIETNYKPGLGKVNEALGNFFFQKGNNSLALNYFLKAKTIYDTLEMPNAQAEILSSLGELNLHKKQYQQALEYYHASFDICERLGLKHRQMICAMKLSEIYTALGKNKLAFHYFRAYISLKDTIFNIEMSKHISEIEERYESGKKEQQIQFLQKNNELQYTRNRQMLYTSIAVGGFIVVFFLLIVLYLRQNRLKAIHEKIMIQQKLLRSQMNPHFIFNSMASIQNYIIDEKPEKANIYLARFAKLMRNILDSSAEEFVPLASELSTIENYLELQKVRYHNMFNYSFEIDERIDVESVMIPPMLAQPFIENSIEHGFRHKKDKGNMKISFKLNGELIHFEVEDDGIGRQKSQEIKVLQNENYKSMATLITLERINILNKKMKTKILLKIEDLKNEIGNPLGTRVIFDIPYKT